MRHILISMICLSCALTGGIYASNLGPALELACPCTFSSDEQLNASITVGVTNIADTETGPLTLIIAAHPSRSIYDSEYFELASIALGNSLGAQANLDSQLYEATANQLAAGEYYITFALVDDALGGFADSVGTGQRISIGGAMPAISVTSLDFLNDSDGDGIADENEKLAATDANNPSSKPGGSTIDLLFLYSEGVPGLYGGDPSTRFDHLINYSNQILSDSQVDFSFRLVGSEMLAMTEQQEIGAWLNDADNRQGAFSDLTVLRDKYNADLVIMFQPIFDSADTCGIANIGGFPFEGDFSSSQNVILGHTAIYIDECSDHTMLHEIGHLMGLGHSFKQNETGTFDWSRGHGIDNSFTTVMGYGDVFNAEELPFMSNPNIETCDGNPCGIDVGQSEAAFSSESLNVVRFQVANYDAISISEITGLWWNPDESGWGVTLTQQYGIVFATLFTYNESGIPTWYVASNCAVSGSGCSGELYEVTGGAPLTEPWTGTAAASVGNISFSFSDRNNGVMNIEINGVNGTKELSRQVFSSISGSSPMAGLWWNPNESGWGVTVTQQTGVVFVTMFTYDTNGQPSWFVASNCVVSASGCTGDLYEVTAGHPTTELWVGDNLTVTDVGEITLLFSDVSNGTMTFSINGESGSKTIERQVWATQ